MRDGALGLSRREAIVSFPEFAASIAQRKELWCSICLPGLESVGRDLLGVVSVSLAL